MRRLTHPQNPANTMQHAIHMPRGTVLTDYMKTSQLSGLQTANGERNSDRSCPSRAVQWQFHCCFVKTQERLYSIEYSDAIAIVCRTIDQELSKRLVCAQAFDLEKAGEQVR